MAVFAATALLIPASAATAAGSGENLLVSRPGGFAMPPFGVAGPSFAGRDRSTSGDGRFVVFESGSDGLVAGGTSRHRQMFVRDLQQNTTRLVSRTPDGRPATACPATRSSRSTAAGSPSPAKLETSPRRTALRRTPSTSRTA